MDSLSAASTANHIRCKIWSEQLSNHEATSSDVSSRSCHVFQKAWRPNSARKAVRAWDERPVKKSCQSLSAPQKIKSLMSISRLFELDEHAGNRRFRDRQETNRLEFLGGGCFCV